MSTQFNTNAASFRPQGVTVYASDLPGSITNEELLAFVQEKTQILP